MAKGAEANVLAELTMDKQYQIKPNFSAIAEKYGMDRHTVKKYWEQGGKIDRERSPKTSKYAPYRKEIDDVMGKPGVTVRSAWEFLKDVHPGISGAYFGFRDYVRSIGWLPRGKQQPHPRFETELGEQLQVDWKEDVRIRLKDGTEVERQIFSATLGASRFHVFVPSSGKGTDDFVRCLIESLRRIGGVPRHILTDNMAAVVACRGGTKKKLPRIVQLERDLGCPIILCRARSPQTKGKVESSNRFLDRLAAYDGALEGEAEVDAKIALVERESDAEVNRTTGVPPAAAFRMEKERLLPLPSRVMLESYVEESYSTRVDSTMLARCRGGMYSVPARMIGKTVVAVPTGGMVYIFREGELVAEHRESQARVNYRPEDYREGLAAAGVPEDKIDEMSRKSLERMGSL